MNKPVKNQQDHGKSSLNIFICHGEAVKRIDILKRAMHLNHLKSNGYIDKKNL